MHVALTLLVLNAIAGRPAKVKRGVEVSVPANYAVGQAVAIIAWYHRTPVDSKEARLNIPESQVPFTLADDARGSLNAFLVAYHAAQSTHRYVLRDDDDGLALVVSEINGPDGWGPPPPWMDVPMDVPSDGTDTHRLCEALHVAAGVRCVANGRHDHFSTGATLREVLENSSRSSNTNGWTARHFVDGGEVVIGAGTSEEDVVDGPLRRAVAGPITRPRADAPSIRHTRWRPPRGRA